LLLLFRFTQIGIYANIVLALVFTEVKYFKRPVVFPIGFEFALDTNNALARCVDRKFAEIACHPFATKSFGGLCRSAGPTEEVCDKVALPGGCHYDSF